jgi:hypothetical protein
MSIFYYIIGYIVLSIAIAYYLKNKKKSKQLFDRKKHNDYMNNPKFSYMSCNKYNPESAFFKKPYSMKEKKYIIIEESGSKKYSRNHFGFFKNGNDMVTQKYCGGPLSALADSLIPS